MPYSKKAKYRHIKKNKTSDFLVKSIKTIPISTVPKRMYRGSKYRTSGVKVRIGKNKNTGNWVIISFLVPKR